MKSRKCIIFGASKGGRNAYSVLSRDFEVLGFSDNNDAKWGTEFCGKMVIEPSKLKELGCEVIIASVYYAAINEQLILLGLKNISVFYCLGNPGKENTVTYKLYRLPKNRLFALCKADEKLWKKIGCNFSLNYAGRDSKYGRCEVKETERKYVLFCAYIFPPLGGSGVQRSLKFVKYLRNFGYEPIVLTVGQNDQKIPYDNSLLDEIPEGITVIRIDQDVFLPEMLSAEKQLEIFNLYGGVVQSVEWMEEYRRSREKYGTRLIPDSQMIWVNECLRNIEDIVDLKKIDVVYTTGNPYSTYFLGYYLKGKYGMKWVQDYRDPWMTNKYYLDNYHKDWEKTRVQQKILEKCLTDQADAIVTVAQGLAREYEKEYGIPLDKVFAVVNGYDESDFAGISRGSQLEKFTLCYNGTLYVDEDPTRLLMAINNLISENKIDSSRIQWIFNGEVEKRWKDSMDAMDQFHIVQYNGYLPHARSIQIAMDSNLLIVFGAKGEGSEDIYAGKVFEYIRMGVPILSFSLESGAIGQLLSETNTGKNVDYDNVAEMAEYLLQLYQAWENGQALLQSDWKAINKYSRENLTRKLAKIFDRLLKEGMR